MKFADKEDKASWGLFLLCFMVYVFISMSKSAYSASMVAIISDGVFSKSYAGIINSAFYLLYGGAQLLCGKLIDKTSPTKLMAISLFGSAVALFGMGFADSFAMMLVIWCISGLAQFATWPAVLRILAESLLPMHRQKAMTYISFGYCIGMLLNYLGASVVLEWLDWRALFYIEGAVMSVTFLLWFMLAGKLTKILKKANETYKKPRYQAEAVLPDQEKKNIGIVKLMMKSGVIFLLVSVFIRSSLDLGVKAWVPTMIMESYSGISASFATMLTTILLVVNLSGVFITDFFYPKRIKSAVMALGLCFAVSLPPLVLLLFTGSMSVWLVVLMLMIVTTMMYAGNRLSVVIIPSEFTDYGKVGSIAGIINAFASFGALVSNYCYGLMAEHLGWTWTMISWVALAGIAFLFCMFAVPNWKKFTQR